MWEAERPASASWSVWLPCSMNRSGSVMGRNLRLPSSRPSSARLCITAHAHNPTTQHTPQARAYLMHAESTAGKTSQIILVHVSGRSRSRGPHKQLPYSNFILTDSCLPVTCGQAAGCMQGLACQCTTEGKTQAWLGVWMGVPWEPKPPMPFSSTVIMTGCSRAICRSSGMSNGLQNLHISATSLYASLPPSPLQLKFLAARRCLQSPGASDWAPDTAGS